MERFLVEKATANTKLLNVDEEELMGKYFDSPILISTIGKNRKIPYVRTSWEVNKTKSAHLSPEDRNFIVYHNSISDWPNPLYIDSASSTIGFIPTNQSSLPDSAIFIPILMKNVGDNLEAEFKFNLVDSFQEGNHKLFNY